MPKVRAHLTISGHVQGVFFRDSMRQEARSLGVTGWVRNTVDGRVEAVAEGERDTVERLIAWSHRGPAGARVEKVDVDWEAYAGEFSRFDITHFRW